MLTVNKMKKSTSDDGSTGSKKGGNIRSPSCVWFVFTIHDCSLDSINWLQQLECKYVFQKEICPDTGNAHLQGVCKFDVKKRFEQLHKMWPYKTTIWWATCKDADNDRRTPKKAKAYCSDPNKRMPGTQVYANMLYPKPWRGPILEDLLPYHLDILKIIESESNWRDIHWYWSKEGQMQKSKFSRYAIHNHNALKVSSAGKDILYAVSEWVSTEELTLLIVDIPRSRYNKISYAALEEIKDADFFSSKYKSAMTTLPEPPHIIVFANKEPNYGDCMSNDRWIVTEIYKENDTICTRKSIVPDGNVVSDYDSS